jgi:hypothetical protein
MFSSLTLPFDYVYFSKLNMVVQTIDYATGNTDYLNVTCSERDKIDSMLDAFKTGNDFESLCGGYSWRVFTCAQSRVMCLNCKRTCVESEACPSNALVINPCMGGCEMVHGASSALVNAQYSRERLYPLYQNPLNVTVIGKSSLLVEANVTAAGIVYCNAFTSGSSVQGVSSIKAAKNSAVAFLKSIQNTTSAYMQIDNLDPDTTYDIYCYTEDYDGRVMNMIDSSNARVLGVRTECCRQMEFTAAVSSQIVWIDGSRIPEVPFSFNLGSIPVGDVRVKVIPTEVSCDQYRTPSQYQGVARLTISPTYFNFTSTSSIVQGSFLVCVYVNM